MTDTRKLRLVWEDDDVVQAGEDAYQAHLASNPADVSGAVDARHSAQVAAAKAKVKG